MSTISGNAKTITGVAGRVKVRFDLINPVFQDGALTLLGSHQVRTEADGDFGLELRAGDYKVFFNEAEYFQIAVPDDDAGYTIDQLVTSEIAMPPASPVTGDAPVATDSVTGTVRTLTTNANPTVPRVEDIPAVLAALTGSFRLKDGNQMQLKNISDNKWHSLYIANVDGLPMLQIAENGET